MKKNDSGEMGVIGQVRTAAGNPIALAIGCLLGGFVPFATYFVAHSGNGEFKFDMSLALVLGGLVYSAKTVWSWGRMAFDDAFKATGFVLLLEGVMVTSPVGWLAVAALCYLVSINAVATGCLLALRDAKKAKRSPRAKKAASGAALKTSRKPRAKKASEASGEFKIENVAG